jgi:hypothetical protein
LSLPKQASVSDPWAPPPPVRPALGSDLLPVALPPRRIPAVVLTLVASVTAMILTLTGGAIYLVGRPSHARARPVVASQGARAQPAGPGDTAQPDPGSGSAQLPVALTAAPKAGSGSVLSPGAAESIVRSLWPIRENALLKGDVPTLRELEDGPALRGDLVRVGCGCGLHRLVAEPILGLRTYLTRQTSFPAQFIAEVHDLDGHDLPFVEWFVLTRQSAAASWHVTLATSTEFAQVQPFDIAATDGTGYDQKPTPAQVDLSKRQPSLLAAYWQRAKDTGATQLPPTFSPGYYTDQWARKSAAQPNDSIYAPSGLRIHTEYYAKAGDPMYVERTIGRTLACGVFHRDTRYTAGTQGPYQSASRNTWGQGLAPGDYREIDGTALSQTCFYLHDADPGVGTEVLGADPGSETVAVGKR